jgi:lycopene cyclase domain-containing protein
MPFGLSTHYTYFFILAGSLIGPLCLSFDKKVAFYKKWKNVFAAMFIPAVFYIIWDGVFAGQNIWHFNTTYIATKPNIFNLPLEEILFFFVVPYCCTFVYECVVCYFPKLQTNKTSEAILWIIAFGTLALGLLNLDKMYTSYTSIFLACFIFIVMALRKYFAEFNCAAFLVAYVLILIPYAVVNGFLTALPVVIYDNTQNLGVRIYTIPFEDMFYGMLLVMMNIVGYEKLRHLKN